MRTETARILSCHVQLHLHAVAGQMHEPLK